MRKNIVHGRRIVRKAASASIIYKNVKKSCCRDALRKEVRLSYIRLTVSAIAWQLYYAMHSDIVLRTVLGEYNITETVSVQYHFCHLAKISLQTFSLQYHFYISKKCYFRQVFPLSKYVAHYETFIIPM